MMELKMEIISRHKFLTELKPDYVFSEAGGYIGRSPESDWILPDRGKKVSRKHVLITCDGKNFYLEDLSSNGIMATLTQELVGKGGKHKIEHGDAFQIGDYVLQARLLMDPGKYTSPQTLESFDNIIPDEAFIDLDPLKALDQEDERNARQRLGFYDDLLNDPKAAPAAVEADHNEPRLDVLNEVRGIPDDGLGMYMGGLGKPSEPPVSAMESVTEAIILMKQTISQATQALKILEKAKSELKRLEAAAAFGDRGRKYNDEL